jgi:TadE-like protein
MGGRGSRGRRSQHGQATTELALSSVALLFLLFGLLDLGRVFYMGVRLQDAAREGARVGAAYDPTSGTWPGLSDASIGSAVKDVLEQIGLSDADVVVKNPSTTCPATQNNNPEYNQPYKDTAFPPGPGVAWVYICYEDQPGTEPPLTTPSAQDLNVIVLYRFGLLSPLFSQFGPSGIPLVGAYHAKIQGP